MVLVETDVTGRRGWKKGEGGRCGFMSRVMLLLTVAYYGNFLKLSVASAAEQCKQKMDNYWTVNCGGYSVIYVNTDRKVNSGVA